VQKDVKQEWSTEHLLSELSRFNDKGKKLTEARRYEALHGMPKLDRCSTSDMLESLGLWPSITSSTSTLMSDAGSPLNAHIVESRAVTDTSCGQDFCAHGFLQHSAPMSTLSAPERYQKDDAGPLHVRGEASLPQNVPSSKTRARRPESLERSPQQLRKRGYRRSNTPRRSLREISKLSLVTR